MAPLPSFPTTSERAHPGPRLGATQRGQGRAGQGRGRAEEETGGAQGEGVSGKGQGGCTSSLSKKDPELDPYVVHGSLPIVSHHCGARHSRARLGAPGREGREGKETGGEEGSRGRGDAEGRGVGERQLLRGVLCGMESQSLFF